MLEYLKTVFGNDIILENYIYPDNTPFYIRDGYTSEFLSFRQNKCVLLTPKSSEWRLPTIKKQLLNFQETCPFSCALSLDKLTALQRRNLIENNIPFISPDNQVYLPFWGCCFSEHFKSHTNIADKMSPGTQLVFLYLYYSQISDGINLTKLAHDLSLSKATCTRAIDDLSESGLVTIRINGTNKFITTSYEKELFLKSGYSRLRNPVEKSIYVKELFQNLTPICSGVIALSEISMVCANRDDGAYAVSKKSVSDIPSDFIQSEQEFKDFGGSVLEVWCYDPNILSQNRRVDDISLLLSLENNNDERIQIALDAIRKRHGLMPVTEQNEEINNAERN